MRTGLWASFWSIRKLCKRTHAHVTLQSISIVLKLSWLLRQRNLSLSIPNKDKLVLIPPPPPQCKTLDQILYEKPTTEALLTITSVDDEDILVTPGDSKKAKITKDLATEMKSQTDLLQCFMDRSQDNQQRMVKAWESQAKSFSEYLDFLKSRNQQAQPDGSQAIGGHPRARVTSPSYQYQAYLVVERIRQQLN